MFGGKSQSSVRPVALGATVQSSTYGATIPVLYGRTLLSLILIWQANIRQVGSKKGNKKKGKKGQASYACNLDFLIGHNPILGVLQFWENQNQKLPLNFVKYTAGDFLSGSITVPDPQFYAVIGVTLSATFVNVSFNDYGGTGLRTYPNTPTEIPLWNMAYRVPNPARGSGMIVSGYYWTPALGATVLFPSPSIGAQALPAGQDLAAIGAINIYYAELWPGGASAYNKKSYGGGTAVPAGALNLTFEPVLGDGPEFTGNDNATGQALVNQKILYPHYAGLGSQNFNMGGSAMPQIQPEVQGTFGRYATGDCDFADMFEDILVSGQTQAGFATINDTDAVPIASVQHGLNMAEFPGIVQELTFANLEANNVPVPYAVGNAAGNFLVVANCPGVPSLGAGASAITDTYEDDWKAIATGNPGQAWWAQAKGGATGINFVTLSGGITYHWQTSVMEIGGVDTFDASVMVDTPGLNPLSGATNPVSITTTNAPNTKAFLLAIAFYNPDNIIIRPPDTSWSTLVGGDQGSDYYIAYKTVSQPGSYDFVAWNAANFHVAQRVVLFSFKQVAPPPYPKALGNIIDGPSIDLTRLQCRAAGLYGSFLMDSQQKAGDYLADLCTAMNAWPVWSGFTLKVVPRSEVSAFGNGAYYIAPTASGPVARLTSKDFVVQEGEPFVKIKRKGQVDIPDILQYQHPNRSSDYNDVTISDPESAAVAIYGPRKASPKQMRMFQDPVMARMIIGIEQRRQNLIRLEYSFTLNASRGLFEPTDLITIPDPDTGLNLDAAGNDISVPVRLTEASEQDNQTINCVAEPFIYGIHAPVPVTVTGTQPYRPQLGGSPGGINAPVIFEPVPRLLAQQNQGQIWAVVSHAFVVPPANASIPTVTTGTLTPGNYYVVLTYVGSNGGESTASPESGAVPIPSTGGFIVVPSPPASPGAVGYNVYVSQIGQPGSETKQNATPIAIGTDYTANTAQNNTPPPVAYGGCLVYLSTDGGNSYNQLGQIRGSADTGVTTADWPASPDPDTTNTLALDLTESAGALASYQVADEDNFVYPCYVGGGLSAVPNPKNNQILVAPSYELMTYADAELTAPYQYALQATSPNHLRRAVFGAPNVGEGVDHPTGSRFAFLDPSGTGIFKVDMDPLWIGQTIYFKFLPVNAFGGGAPSLASVPSWPYTPTGVAMQENPNNNYTNTPIVALSRTSATTISMVQVNTQFPSNQAIYNPRTFTIPSPSQLTVYYVTIADTAYLGDTGSETNLQATCSTDNSLVGVPGNTYMGFIQVNPAGLSQDIVGPGSWPSPFTAIVGP